MTDNLTIQIKGFYYYCDPDNANTEMHHYPIPYIIDDPTMTLPVGWHREKPSDKLKDPVWSIDQQAWIENDHTNQGEAIAVQSKQIKDLIAANKTLTKANEDKDGQIDQLQKTVAQSNQMAAKLGTQFNQFGTKMTQAMSKVTEAVNKLTEESKNKNSEGSGK